MSFLGKILGGTLGFMFGGPIGAILGTALGHKVDSNSNETISLESWGTGEQERVQMAFFAATFSIMGHVAKADGHVSQPEIDLAIQVMRKMALSDELRKAAMNLFDQGKQANFPLDEVLSQFRKECHRRSHLMQMFLEIQLQIAFADGVLDERENNLLIIICQKLKISRFDYERLKLSIQAQHRFEEYAQQSVEYSQKNKLKDAYAVLGIETNANDAEIKKAYRRLMSQHHPDKLVAKGLPVEMMTLAKEKTQKIRKAYELIRDNRLT